MTTYIFYVQHGYSLLKGYVDAESLEEAKKLILNEEWEDIIDTESVEDFVEHYKIIEVWENEI